MEELFSKIMQTKRATATLEQMRALCGASSYPELYALVTALVQQGKLSPIGGRNNTNGLIPPLQLKYHVLRPEKNSLEEAHEIMLLHTNLNRSGYLANRKRYRQDRALLLPLSDFLKRHRDSLEQPMSKNERAYDIWRYEKQLNDSQCQSLLKFNALESTLNYYLTPEPFFDYLPRVKEARNILILENKDIWYTLRRLLMLRPERCRLFGLYLDGLIYGEGRKAARPGGLEAYASALPEAAFWYLGDIDFSGFDIYQAVREANLALKLQLFAPAYHTMLVLGTAQNLGPCPKEQLRPAQLAGILSALPPEDAAAIEALLARGQYIPQEILNYPFLAEVMEA